MYRRYGKKIIDYTLSAIGLVVCAIPMLVVALLIKLDSRGPVLFRQKRLGKNKKVFTVYKFRTMCVNAYEMGGIATRSDDVRITKVGAVLRRTSLDELPQMINILKGEMSIIGPRPILPVEFEPYKGNKKYEKRFRVLPGMFCTIDVVDRAPERDFQFIMDAKYAQNVTFWKDFATFFRIIRIVISGRNVYHEEVDKRFSAKNKVSLEKDKSTVPRVKDNKSKIK